MGAKMKKTRNILMAMLAFLAVVLWGSVCILHWSNDTWAYGQISVVNTPDRTESVEHPYFVKEEYVPIVLEGTNIMESAKIEANGYNDVYTPRKVKDGKTLAQSYWEGKADAYPNILSATFDNEYKIYAMKLCLNPQPVWGTRTQTLSVEISVDGENFTELLKMADYEFNPDHGNEVVIEFDEISCKVVRLVFTANTGARGAQLAEWEVYSKDANLKEE